MTAHGRLKTVLFIAALLLPAIDAAEQAAILRPYAFPKPAEPHIDRPLTPVSGAGVAGRPVRRCAVGVNYG